MPHEGTVTGVVGPGNTATAVKLSDITEISFRVDKSVLEVKYAKGQKTAHVSLGGVTTVTYSISGGQVTLTVS